MPSYCVNRQAQANGDHEVHEVACKYLPAPQNQLHLGTFPSCRGAVQEAKKHFPQSNGCYFCSRECNTG